MDINDPRIGPLCSSTYSKWMAFRVGDWEGGRAEAECYTYTDDNFLLKMLDTRGFLDVDTFALPKEYAL